MLPFCHVFSVKVRIRPSFKKKFVSGPAAVWVFSFRLGIFIFYLNYFNFLQKRGGRVKILLTPDWPQFWPPAGQETNFFVRMDLAAMWSDLCRKCLVSMYIVLRQTY